jgi:hypothetical protein
MTRNRKGVRPLSQSGLIRVPRGAGQRVPDGDHKRHVLDTFNETQDTRQVHPTKGWRKLNVKRARAQMLMGELRMGNRLTTAQMGNFIRDGLA